MQLWNIPELPESLTSRSAEVINTLLRMENLSDLSGSGLNEMPCTCWVFFVCYTATRANRTGLTEYLTHLNIITANMSVTHGQ